MSDAAAVDAKGPSKKELSKLAKKNKIAAGPKEDNAKFIVLFCKGASPDMTRAVELYLGTDGVVKYCINKGAEAHLPQFKSVSDEQLSGSGDANIARFLAASNQALTGADAAKAMEINTWLDVYGHSLCAANVRDSLVTVANAHLADKTYFVGAELTLADIAMWTALRKISFVAAYDAAPHASRWFDHVTSLIPWSAIPVSVLAPATPAPAAGAAETKKAASSSSAATAEAEDDASGALGSCPPLEGAVEGQVCTRFPPEPSGYLHIGTFASLFWFLHKYCSIVVCGIDSTLDCCSSLNSPNSEFTALRFDASH